MKLSIHDFTSHHWVGVGAAAAILAGCGGELPQTSVLQQGIPGWQATQAGTPACPGVPRGEIQCLALIQSKSGISPTVAGWAPADFQARYKLPSSKKGSGQIVALVDAYDNPHVAKDLSAYRSYFRLGKAKFFKYNQEGERSNYPSPNAGWGVEIDLDAQMVSATCPLCTIYLIEADSADYGDFEVAEAEAVKLGAHIVSNSWICYGSVSCVKKSYFDKPGVEYLAGSGDDGINHIGAPAALDSVAAIGGTILSKNGSQYHEVVWNGAGGGCAKSIQKPKWQHDKICSGRALGDASAVAMGVAEYDTYGYGGWLTVGGTSVSSPLLAGVFGLAGNARLEKGGRTFWNPLHRNDLYDVCHGSCLFGKYSYGGGWGSPNGIGAF
jgi:subtilase family serine protease